MKNFAQKLEQQLDIKIIHSKEPIPFESTYSINENDQIEIMSTSQSQHLRENTVFVTVFYRLPQ